MADHSSSYRATVTLEGTQPPIWRTFLINADTTLSHLHDILQEVMGWENYHLYQFHLHDIRYGPVNPDLGLDDMQDAASVTLRDIAASGDTTFGYEYDFGDSWHHRLDLETVTTAPAAGEMPIVLAGERACPPEDCGGVWGYAELLAALADPHDPENEEVLEWLGDDFDPEAFDIAEANERLEHFR